MIIPVGRWIDRQKVENMTDSERIRKMLGVSRAEFSRRYDIPIRTLEEWDAGRRVPPKYVVNLLERVVKEDMKDN